MRLTTSTSYGAFPSPAASSVLAVSPSSLLDISSLVAVIERRNSTIFSWRMPSYGLPYNLSRYLPPTSAQFLLSTCSLVCLHSSSFLRDSKRTFAQETDLQSSYIPLSSTVTTRLGNAFTPYPSIACPLKQTPTSLGYS